MPETFSFFSDENNSPEVAIRIRDQGYNITFAAEQGLSGLSVKGIIENCF